MQIFKKKIHFDGTGSLHGKGMKFWSMREQFWENSGSASVKECTFSFKKRAKPAEKTRNEPLLKGKYSKLTFLLLRCWVWKVSTIKEEIKHQVRASLSSSPNVWASRLWMLFDCDVAVGHRERERERCIPASWRWWLPASQCSISFVFPRLPLYSRCFTSYFLYLGSLLFSSSSPWGFPECVMANDWFKCCDPCTVLSLQQRRYVLSAIA